MKQLIINADDFGYSKIFNKSILDLIKKDLISSTTVMVNYISKEQKEQVQKLIFLKNNHELSIGLHLDFINSNYEEEIKKQFEQFFKIFNFKPSHLDVHKPNNSNEEFLAVLNFCKENKLPCRNLGFNYEDIKTTTQTYINGTDNSFEDLNSIIKNFKNKETYEILFHPGTYDKDCKSSLNKKREEDIEKIKLINPILKEEKIELVSYNNLEESEYIIHCSENGEIISPISKFYAHKKGNRSNLTHYSTWSMVYNPALKKYGLQLKTPKNYDKNQKPMWDM